MRKEAFEAGELRRSLEISTGGNSPDLLPIRSCPPNPRARFGPRARASEKQLWSQREGFFPAAKTAGQEICWDPTG